MRRKKKKCTVFRKLFDANSLTHSLSDDGYDRKQQVDSTVFRSTAIFFDSELQSNFETGSNSYTSPQPPLPPPATASVSAAEIRERRKIIYICSLSPVPNALLPSLLAVNTRTSTSPKANNLTNKFHVWIMRLIWHLYACIRSSPLRLSGQRDA